MDRLSEVFKEANHAAEERMKWFDDFLKSPHGKEFIARCCKQKPNPAFVAANKAAEQRMSTSGFAQLFAKKV